MGAFRFFFGAFSTLVFSSTVLANPQGFDDATLQKVLAGQTVLETKVDTADEYHVFQRAYFKQVDVSDYIALAVNHPKYEEMFEEVQEAKTTSASADKTVYTYDLSLKVKVGFATFYVDGQGKQEVTYATAADEESVIKNQLVGQEQKVKFFRQNTRLIPYQDGILVEDELHLKMQQASTTNTMVKNYLKSFFNRYVEAFKKELGATN